MATNKLSWVVPAMKVGHAARAIVYLLMGVLALNAALGAGESEGPQGAMASLLRQPFGQLLIALVGLGLGAYALWRFLDAALDLERKGDKAKGFIARGGQFLAGATHLMLALYAGALAMRGASASGGGDSTANITAAIMDQPFGRILIGLSGILVLCIGAYHFVKAAQEKYKQHMRSTAFTSKAAPALKFGLYAHGVVIGLVGLFLIYAAWTHDPQHAAGLGETLRRVEHMPLGPYLLGAAALGLIAFAFYCFVEARYRVLPPSAGESPETLANSDGITKNARQTTARFGLNL